MSPEVDDGVHLGCLSVLTFGESWHNNHHPFPTAAFHGLRRGSSIPEACFGSAMGRFGCSRGR
jgi:hypothetical protein